MNIETIEITYKNEDTVLFTGIIDAKTVENFYSIYFGDKENRFQQYINLDEIKSIWIKYKKENLI